MQNRNFDNAGKTIAAFFDYVDENARMLDESSPAVSSIGFIRRLTDGFNLLD